MGIKRIMGKNFGKFGKNKQIFEHIRLKPNQRLVLDCTRISYRLHWCLTLVRVMSLI